MHGLDAVARTVDARDISASRRAALILAVVGSVLALACIAALARVDRGLVVDGAARLAPPFVIATGTLLVLAWWGGGRCARFLHEPRFVVCLLGSVFAELTLLLAALVGATSGLVLDRQPFVFGVGVALIDGIVKPIYWTALFGSLPAIALGAAFPRTARRFLGHVSGVGPGVGVGPGGRNP